LFFSTKNRMTHLRIFWFQCLSAFVFATLCSVASAQEKRQFEYTTYSVPRGFVAQSESSPTARAYLKRFDNGEFALLTLYTSTGSFGDPQVDFSRRWQQLIAEMTTTKKEPSTTRTPLSSAVGISGYETITFNNQPAAALLLTVTVKGRLLTFVAIFSGEKSGKEVEAFLGRIDVDDERIPLAQSSSAAMSIQAPRTVPSIQSNAGSQRSGAVNDSRILGRWQNHFATTRVSKWMGDFIFKADGRFENPTLANQSRKISDTGVYQLSGNSLRLVFDGGVTENYTLRFETQEIMNEMRPRIVFIDERGGERVFYFARDQSGRWGG
jgi:hypothetical protein